MKNTIARTELWFCQGSSDKVYNATITKQDGTYNLIAEYGRRGSFLNKYVKASGMSFYKAEREYIKLINSKKDKGYEEITSWMTKEGRTHSL